MPTNIKKTSKLCDLFTLWHKGTPQTHFLMGHCRITFEGPLCLADVCLHAIEKDERSEKKPE